MRIIFFPDDARIRTSEGQDYKRTVYLLDHNVTGAVVSSSTIFTCATFPDDTRIRTSEGQDYKRTVYLLDHNVTAAVVSSSTIFISATTTVS